MDRMSTQKQQERSLQLEAIGERLGRAIDAEVKQARAIGDHGLERKLVRMKASLDADVRDRQEACKPIKRKPRGVAEWYGHVAALRAQYAARPLLQLVEVDPRQVLADAKRTERESRKLLTHAQEVLDAG